MPGPTRSTPCRCWLHRPSCSFRGSAGADMPRRTSSLPYADASSGDRAYAEIEKILRGFGCTQFGVMNDWQNGAVILQFQYRDRQVSITASWHGYATLWLKAHPWRPQSRRSGKQHEELARKKGEIAVPSILRDW